MSPGLTCLGQVAMFTCSNVDNTGISVAIWRFNNATSQVDQCLVKLELNERESDNCGSDDEFTAIVVSATGTSYISTLAVTAAVDLNGTLVLCVGATTFSDYLQVISK